MDKTSLGDRMKNYEHSAGIKLINNVPVIIRIDGKAFHSYTRGMEKPFSNLLKDAMEYTAESLLTNIDGCKLAYAQSDEISLLITDYDKIDTQPWFDYKKYKLESVSASIATAYFNRFMDVTKHNTIAMFDARSYNMPKEEVVNYFIWRQQDATRNSIQMLGGTYFSHKQLHGKSCDEIQDMLFKEHNINWNDTDVCFKRGSAVYKEKKLWYELATSSNSESSCPMCGSMLIEGKEKSTKCGEAECKFQVKSGQTKTIIIKDRNIPIFTQDRNFIEKFV